MITLTKNHLNEIQDHAQKESPNEACGILAGRAKRVETVYQCKNISENPKSHYVIAPEKLIEVFNDIEKNEFELIGFYHSHPSGPNGPSNTDQSEATYPDHSYVILHPEGIGSWIWDEEEGQFILEEVQVV